jgi:Protein of unknown function (DUF2721)
MQMQLDVPKLVGAASAPVALIIASSIFLSNLSAKYGMLGQSFRRSADEYRKLDDKPSLWSRSLEKQLGLYSRRLQILIRATFWLGVCIVCFIATVLFTSVSVLIPKSPIPTIITGAFSFAGLIILGVCVILEIVENHCAKEALVLETAEFPGVLSSRLEEGKKDLRHEHETEVQRRRQHETELHEVRARK